MGRKMTWMWLMMVSISADGAIISSDSADSAALSLPELRLIFARQILFWPDGKPIRVFVLPLKSPSHQRFCIDTLGVMPYLLQRNWDKQVFSGTAEPPEIVSSVEEMKHKVRGTLGAIGYLPDDIEIVDEIK